MLRRHRAALDAQLDRRRAPQGPKDPKPSRRDASPTHTPKPPKRSHHARMSGSLRSGDLWVIIYTILVRDSFERLASLNVVSLHCPAADVRVACSGLVVRHCAFLVAWQVGPSAPQPRLVAVGPGRS